MIFAEDSQRDHQYAARNVWGMRTLIKIIIDFLDKFHVCVCIARNNSASMLNLFIAFQPSRSVVASTEEEALRSLSEQHDVLSQQMQLRLSLMRFNKSIANETKQTLLNGYEIIIGRKIRLANQSTTKSEPKNQTLAETVEKEINKRTRSARK